MSAAYGGTAKQAGLDGHAIQPKKLQEIAGKREEVLTSDSLRGTRFVSAGL